MELIRQITRQLEAWWAYTSWCSGQPLSAPACRTFWTGVAVVGVIVGLFIAWKVLTSLLRPLRLWLDERRRLAKEAEVADAATMAQYKVDDSKLHAGPGQEDVERKIREALLEKKLTDQQRPHPSRKP